MSATICLNCEGRGAFWPDDPILCDGKPCPMCNGVCVECLGESCRRSCEATQICSVCWLRKKPIGRDSRDSTGLCTSDCQGYAHEPMPGHLWPGEFERELLEAAREAQA